MGSNDVQDKVLEAIGRAEDLIQQKEEYQKAQKEAFETLPLFHPGKCYSASRAAGGFRVLDGYPVSFNAAGDVKVSNKRGEAFENGKALTIIPKTADGSLAWVYWSQELDLENAMIKHGMGGWCDRKRDMRCKVIFLDEGRSFDYKRCFFLAMERLSNGDRILIKGSEENPMISRVYQSAIPEKLQKFIALRELINVRDGGEVPGFWNM